MSDCLESEFPCRDDMKTELVALKGKLYAKTFQLEAGQCVVIGRGDDVDIQILDNGLSRHHCSLERQGDVFFINDLASRNGTWVNDRRITREQLQPSDKVRIGGMDFEFRCGPDRRRVNADLIAAVPEKPQTALKERVSLEDSDLMDLSSKFQSMENYRRMQRDLATIYRIGNLISGETDLPSLYNRILEVILGVVNADRGFLLLCDADGKLEPVTHREKAGSGGAAGMEFSRTIVDEAFHERTSIIRANALEDARYRQAESVLLQNIHSVLCAPIETPDRTIGVIYVDTVAQSEVFMKHDLELLVAIGKQAGIAVQRVQLSDHLRTMLRGTVRALAAAIEAKDDYTRGHSERVTAYSLQIGSMMQVNPPQMQVLELAGFLHDVGKIGVPENILRKAGPLTQEEYEIVKQHARLGANIVRNIEGADEIAEAVLHHHERWDGKGYPDALAQNKVGILARILSVADAFDAMSSRRPYRDKLAREKVLHTLRESAGAQFDPMVVEAFLRVAENDEGVEELEKISSTEKVLPKVAG